MKKILFTALIIALISSCHEEQYESPVVIIRPGVDVSVVESEIVAISRANVTILSPGSPNNKLYYNWKVGYEFKNLRTKVSGSDDTQGGGETFSSAVRITSLEQAFIEGDSIECKITAQVDVIAKAGNDYITKLTQGLVNAVFYFTCPEVLEN